MADTGATEATTAARRLRFALADTRLLAFMPLCVMLAWWSGEAAVLFVVSFVFPMLLALQELTRPRGAWANAAHVPGRTAAVAGGRAAALAHLAALTERMAESLGIDVLAEGVETPAAQSLLAQLGCRYIQGFAFARPMPFDATLPWLHDHATATGGTAPPPDRRTG